MSIDYEPIIGIGIEFCIQEEVIGFLKENGIITDEDLEAINDTGLEDFMQEHDSGVLVEGLNAFSGWGYVVGFFISPGDKMEFIADFQKAIQKWEIAFPSIPSDLIFETKVF